MTEHDPHPPKPPQGADTDGIVAEHRMLQSLLERLDGVDHLTDLLPLLEELQALLREHFAHEEASGGIREELVDRAPHQIERFEEILNEHGTLLGELERLVQSARDCLDGPVAAIFEGVAELKRRLHEHEARENALFFDSFYLDLGTGD